MDAEIVKILTRFIGRAPPCQLVDVLKGCRILAQTTSLPKELSHDACRDHNESSLLPVSLGTDGAVGVVCAVARGTGEGNQYGTGQEPARTFDIDHERQECTASKDGTLASIVPAPVTAEPFRFAVEKELNNYLKFHYPQRGGITGGGVYAAEGEGGHGFLLKVFISARHSRPRGCWAGTWTSQWNISLDPVAAKKNLGDAPAGIDGKLEFFVHYTEDANVHFRRKHKTQASLSPSCVKDWGSFGREVLFNISSAETAFHEATEEACLTMGSGPLKSLRRVMPMSMERFDWRPIRHSLVRDMKDAVAKDPAKDAVET